MEKPIRMVIESYLNYWLDRNIAFTSKPFQISIFLVTCLDIAISIGFYYFVLHLAKCCPGTSAYSTNHHLCWKEKSNMLINVAVIHQHWTPKQGPAPNETYLQTSLSSMIHCCHKVTVGCKDNFVMILIFVLGTSSEKKSCQVNMPVKIIRQKIGKVGNYQYLWKMTFINVITNPLEYASYKICQALRFCSVQEI